MGPGRLGGLLVRALLAFCLVLGLAGVAQAQESEPMRLRGVDGVWFPLPWAREALGCLEGLDRERERLALTERALGLATSEGAALRGALRTAQDAANARAEGQREALASSIRSEARAARAESLLASPWRSPWLWAVLGVLVGAGGVLAAVAF